MRHTLDKKRLLELTLAVYNVTAIFPVGEELNQKIRGLADKILTKTNENRSRLINEIFGLFDLAEKKNWIDQRNFLVLRREYASYLAEPSYRENSAQPSNNDRRKKIAAALNGNGTVKISDFERLLPGINRRTILRDIDDLCRIGVMVRNGHGRGVYYAKNATMSQ